MPPVRVAAIIVKDDAVALIERRRDGELYYLFPGGGVEGDESLGEALVREILEELGLHIEVDRFVAEVSYRGTAQSYFTVRITGGTFGTGCGQEIAGPTAPDDGTSTPVWVPLANAQERPIRPRAVVELMLNALKVGWPTTPSRFADPARG